MRAPQFWHMDQGSWLQALLTPVSWLYQIGSRLDRGIKAKSAYHPPIPVICVGNLTVGGQGKTPVVADLLDRIAARGIEVHALSRGYGGELEGPVRIDPDRHETSQVGDEPLLLTKTAPVWVAKDRAAGAKAIVDHGVEAMVMDDGFQNPSISKTVSIIVVDGGFGFGNGGLIPAGPLREPVGPALRHVRAVVIIGEDLCGTEPLVKQAAPQMPILKAHLSPTDGRDQIAGKKVVAFAGIGRPEKFYQTLRALDCLIIGAHDFPDHHLFTHDDLKPVIEEARAEGALAVTTAKDAVRVPVDIHHGISVLGVELVWESPSEIETIVQEALDHGRPHT